MERARTKNTQANDNTTSVSYLNLMKSNLGLVLIISLVIFSISLIYAITTEDVYRTSTVLKITEPQGESILGSEIFGSGGSSTDRYIANEIEVMNNRKIREKVAEVIIDSFKQVGQTDNYSLLLNQNTSFLEDEAPSLRSYKSLAGVLVESVDITQKDGLDFIEIIVESPSPTEASLIANTYANVYREYNLLDSRKKLTKLKEYLEEQKDEKQNELIVAEDNLRIHQAQGGGIELGQQALTLIQTTAQFEADRNRAYVEMNIAKSNFDLLKQDLQARDGSLSTWNQIQSAQPEIELLRKEIAGVEIQKTKALSSGNSGVNGSAIISQYDTRIANLNNKLNTLVGENQERLLTSSPQELKQLTQEVFQAQVQYEAAKSQYSQLSGVIASYEGKFNELPQQTLELARLQRKKMAFEKMFIALEEKYQEALINEQSTPGNVLILSDARAPGKPAKPNRPLLAIMGLLLGFGAAFGYIFLKDYFDKTVKTPDDIERENTNVLAWIPKFERKIDKSKKNAEIFVGGSQETAAGESYRSLRTRIQFSKITDGAKSILITSSAPQEGKTTVSSNLAASFAQSNKKTILLDCDLRIPRVNEVFGGQKSPGFTNYLFKQASFEDIVRKTDFENLYYIAAGTIPTNPSEILGSAQMKDFIEKLKREFDVVVIDSPPVMTITDAEILSHIVDMTILVVFAERTEVDWLVESTNQLTSHGQKSFIGTVLNNFDYNSGYRSYNKYNHSKYYTRVDKSKKKEWVES
ncbi:MAG: polysaccharide biosynthesis tyrosine autokinase [Ignavibacteriae bacterium]|nr:polysaccharide biosynthesis tyrosine autokinase [Ignavibacteriota bacterium]